MVSPLRGMGADVRKSIIHEGQLMSYRTLLQYLLRNKIRSLDLACIHRDLAHSIIRYRVGSVSLETPTNSVSHMKISARQKQIYFPTFLRVHLSCWDSLGLPLPQCWPKVLNSLVFS